MGLPAFYFEYFTARKQSNKHYTARKQTLLKAQNRLVNMHIKSAVFTSNGNFKRKDFTSKDKSFHKINKYTTLMLPTLTRWRTPNNSKLMQAWL